MIKRNLLFIGNQEPLGKLICEQLNLIDDYKEVISVSSVSEAIKIINEKWIDVFLLDSDVDEVANGLFFKQISAENCNKPIIIFKGKNESDNLNNFLKENIASENADNFIHTVLYRPFRLSLFLSVLESLINQYENSKETSFKIGNYLLNQGLKQLIDDCGNVVNLTEKEVAIIRYLVRYEGRAVDRTELLSAVWGYNPEVTTHTLETHIYRLRQKIGDAAKYLITNEEGYSLKL